VRRTVLIPLLGVVAIATAAGVLRLRAGPKVEVGGLYSVQDEENEFGSPRMYHVAKVLAVDEAVHVRLYREEFRDRPVKIDVKKLTLGTTRDRDPGIGHMPLSKRAFAALNPVFIQHSAVATTELDGYQEWRKAGGGVWK
jgi:hypothetical protein